MRAYRIVSCIRTHTCIFEKDGENRVPPSLYLIMSGSDEPNAFA